MADAIISALLELMPHTLTATPGTLNEFGDFVASGAVLALPCLIEGETRLVRDAAGREVVSSVQAYVGGSYDLTVEAHRYTLPVGWGPRQNLRALSVGKLSDENGAHHEVVMLP